MAKTAGRTEGTGIGSPSGETPRLGAPQLVVGLLVGTLVVALVSALLAPWIFAAVEALAPGRYPFQRVFRRVAMLAALIAVVVGLRRAGVRRLADFGLRRAPDGKRAIWVGVAWGVFAIAAAFGAELALGNRVAAPEALTATKAASLLAGAAAIGVIEEALCRGALLFPFLPLSGVSLVVANGAVSALYATAHFLRGGGKPGAIDAWSGFRLWAELGRAIPDHVEAWIGLFLTGALLYLVARRQGHVWGAVGTHAGAVAALQLLGTATAPAMGRDPLFLVDGLLPGWGLSVLLLGAIGFFAWRGVRAPAPSE